MTRTHARAEGGQRAQGSAPAGHWTNLTMLGAIRLAGMTAAAAIDASSDTDVFGVFVRESLAPALHPGDVVVWDNLSPHKAAECRLMIEQSKARLLPLPPYSPDLSPIEPCWSKIKQHVRGVEARSVGESHLNQFPSGLFHRPNAYLAAAGIAWEDDLGWRADFHALRGTFGTMLATSGASPNETKELMRHTEMRLTQKHYIDPKVFNLATVVDLLKVPGRTANKQQKTGT